MYTDCSTVQFTSAQSVWHCWTGRWWILCLYMYSHRALEDQIWILNLGHFSGNQIWHCDFQVDTRNCKIFDLDTQPPFKGPKNGSHACQSDTISAPFPGFSRAFYLLFMAKHRKFGFQKPPLFEHTCAYARWAHMHHFLYLSVCPKFRVCILSRGGGGFSLWSHLCFCTVGKMAIANCN